MSAAFAASDKRVGLDALASHVSDGDLLAVGGGLSSREPMAALRALIRAGRRRLQVVGSAHGIDIDLLCGAGAVAKSLESYVGFEQDFGMAPNYRRACESGAVEVADTCCYTVVQQLRAAAYGLPFLPVRSVRGTDFARLHPEYLPMTCPFTGEDYVLLKALTPDVSFVHVQVADGEGNCRIDGPRWENEEQAKAANRIVVIAEEIVSTDEIRRQPERTIIPGHRVEAVVHQPYGAHPTAVYGRYDYDAEHLKLYVGHSKKGGRIEDYLKTFVLGTKDHGEYLDKAGGQARMNALKARPGLGS